MATTPRVLLSSFIFTAALADECRNDQRGSQTDSGCTNSSPICVDASHQQPLQNETGVACVPCISYYESPQEPDWGCSAEEPLCVVADQQRPKPGHAGHMCSPYPCRNTQTNPRERDQGCTALQPTCVDALGNDPPNEQPGVQCIMPDVSRLLFASSATEQRDGDAGVTRLWGSRTGDKEQEQMPFGLRQTASCSTSSKAGQFSFCSGCPFSGGQGTRACTFATPQQTGKMSW